jgi:hypothetical protein
MAAKPELEIEFAKSPDEVPPSSGDDDRSGELDEFDAALEDAFDAVKSGSKDAFKDAMSAAISAKCAEMYAGEEK